MTTLKRLSLMLTLFAALVVMPQTSQAQGDPPSAPANLEVFPSYPGDLSTSLFWIDTSLDEIGFEIQRCVGDDYANFETIAISPYGNFDSYNDVDLAENTVYSYRLRAYNDAGVSDFSNIASAKTSYARPMQVTELQGSYANRQVSLSWVDLADNETRFEVERAEIGVSTEYEIIAVLEPNTTTFVDTTTLSGTSYWYRVRPWRYDVFGGSEDPIEIQTGTGIAAPTRVAARARSRSVIEVTWDGRFPVNARVEVQRQDLTSGMWITLGKVTAKSKKYRDTGLVSQTGYSYRVRTVTRTAVSPWKPAFATTR